MLTRQPATRLTPVLLLCVAIASAACSPPPSPGPLSTPPPSPTASPTPVPTALPGWDYSAAPVDWQNPLPVKYGETVAVHGGGLTISFDEVLEDGRCAYAEGIQCVWEGNARVQLHVQRADDPVGMEIVLNSSARFEQGATYSGYDIILERLEPDLAYVVDPDKEDYVAWIQVLLR